LLSPLLLHATRRTEPKFVAAQSQKMPLKTHLMHERCKKDMTVEMLPHATSLMPHASCCGSAASILRTIFLASKVKAN